MRYAKEQIDQWISEWNQSGQSIIKYCEGSPLTRVHFIIGVKAHLVI
ncbi:MAG: hypothetical protein IPO92_19810 [Saprospiraceae bacterium]|nr:hypothetical protein [Saprospiraceae bacterium]